MLFHLLAHINLISFDLLHDCIVPFEGVYFDLLHTVLFCIISMHIHYLWIRCMIVLYNFYAYSLSFDLLHDCIVPFVGVSFEPSRDAALGR